MERETEIEKTARQMVEQYGRGAGIIADQRAASYVASGDLNQSIRWIRMAELIRNI